MAGQAGRREARRVVVDGVTSAVQWIGGTRFGVWTIKRIVSPLQRRLLQLTGGRVSLTGRAPVLLLTTTGRRSGKERTTPLLYLRDGERVVVCNVNPGFERPNPWTLNLRASPEARVRIGGHSMPCRAREATPSEVDRYWPQFVKLWPAYQAFFDRSGQRTLFVLEETNEWRSARETPAQTSTSSRRAHAKNRRRPASRTVPRNAGR